MTPIGLHFPQAEIPNDSGAIRDFAQSAEAMGFSHLNFPDHVLQTRTPRAEFPRAALYTTQYPHHEVFTLMSFITGTTDAIGLKSAILILPQRQSVLVAKQAAELDVLSNGRLSLGVGLGWNVQEYDSLGMSFKDRGRRLEEQIAVCRALWTEQHVHFEGEWHTIEDAGLAPMPIQRPIPVWIGALTEPAIKRAAKVSDGWQAMFAEPDDTAATAFQNFHELVAASGRNPANVGIEATLWASGDDPDVWVEETQRWIKAGATQVVFRPQGDFATIQHAIGRFGPMLDSIG